MIGCCVKSGQFFYYKCNSHYKKGKDICDTPIKRIELQASEPRGIAFFTMTYSGTTSSTTLPNIQGVIIGPVGSTGLGDGVGIKLTQVVNAPGLCDIIDPLGRIAVIGTVGSPAEKISASDLQFLVGKTVEVRGKLVNELGPPYALYTECRFELTDADHYIRIIEPANP